MAMDAEQAARKVRAVAHVIRENYGLKRKLGSPAQYETCWEASAAELDDVAGYLDSLTSSKEVE